MAGRTARVKELEPEVIRLYGQGCSIRDVAQILGLSDRTVWHVLVDRGVPRRPQGVHGDPTARRRIPELYRQGFTMRQVAEITGFSFSWVWTICKEEGVETRKAGGTYRQLGYKTLMESVLLYRMGYSCEEIGRRLGIHARTVQHRLVTAGEPRRTLSEANRLKGMKRRGEWDPRTYAEEVRLRRSKELIAKFPGRGRVASEVSS